MLFIPIIMPMSTPPPPRGVRCQSEGGQLPVIGESRAHYGTVRSPVLGGKSPVTGGSGANYREIGRPL